MEAEELITEMNEMLRIIKDNDFIEQVYMIIKNKAKKISTYLVLIFSFSDKRLTKSDITFNFSSLKFTS